MGLMVVDLGSGIALKNVGNGPDFRGKSDGGWAIGGRWASMTGNRMTPIGGQIWRFSILVNSHELDIGVALCRQNY